jgi:broad specificity phosphatase PhoE
LPEPELTTAPGEVVERRLYLVRHGECPNVSDDGRLICETPMGLTERGRWQAERLRSLFAEVATDTVYTSDSERAAQTATLLAGERRRIVALPQLREISMGSLDGAPAVEIFAAAPRWLSDPAVALPGGESVEGVAQRAGPEVERIVDDAPGRDVIIVAHGATNRAVIGRLTGMPLAAALRLRQDWSCVNVLDRAGGRWWLGTVNWTPAGLAEFLLSRASSALADSQWTRLGR